MRITYNEQLPEVAEANPIKQGLKHHFQSIFVTFLFVAEANPIKQGLKLYLAYALAKSPWWLQRLIQ